MSFASSLIPTDASNRQPLTKVLNGLDRFQFLTSARLAHGIKKTVYVSRSQPDECFCPYAVRNVTDGGVVLTLTDSYSRTGNYVLAIEKLLSHAYFCKLCVVLPLDFGPNDGFVPTLDFHQFNFSTRESGGPVPQDWQNHSVTARSTFTVGTKKCDSTMNANLLEQENT